MTRLFHRKMKVYQLPSHDKLPDNPVVEYTKSGCHNDNLYHNQPKGDYHHICNY